MIAAWQAQFAHRHARVEIERPTRPPSTAAVLAVIDAEIAAIEDAAAAAPADERPIAASMRGLRLSTLRLHRHHVERGMRAADHIERLEPSARAVGSSCISIGATS